MNVMNFYEISTYPAEKKLIEEIAKEKKSILYKINYSKLKITKSDLTGSRFDYNEREDLRVNMLGSYQPRNAAIVLDAVDNLSSNGLHVSEEAVRGGLLKARWPARFEIIGNNPTVIFDGAHNPQGVRATATSIKDYYGDKRVIILTGVLRDKDYLAITDAISEVADSVYTLTPDNPRALEAMALADIYRAKGIGATPCPSVENALALALEEARRKDTALICLGSLYLYGEVYRAYKETEFCK